MGVVTMALGTPPSGRWTLDDLLRLPEDANRYEIVDGRLLVTPPPAIVHAVAVARLVRLLQDSAAAGFIVLPAGSGVRMGRSVYVPDAVVIDAAPDLTQQVLDATDVRLAVEVLSPSNRTTDLVTKRADYAAAGIPLYWVIDPEIPSLTVLLLEEGAYVEDAVIRGCDPSVATHPFAVTVRPSALLQPPGGRQRSPASVLGSVSDICSVLLSRR